MRLFFSLALRNLSCNVSPHRWQKIFCCCVLAMVLHPHTTPAASGVWTLDGEGAWTGSGNWAGGVVAAGSTSMASFTSPISADRSVLNDWAGPLDLLSFTFGSPSKNWTISGGTFNFTNGAPVIMVNVGTATVGSVFTGNKSLTKGGPGSFVMSGLDMRYGNLTVVTGEYVVAGSRITDAATTNKISVGGYNGSSPAVLTITGRMTNYLGDIAVGGSPGPAGSMVLSNAVYYGLNDNAGLSIGCASTGACGAVWSYNSVFAPSNALSIGSALDSYGFMYLDGGVFDAQNLVGTAPRMGLGGNGGTALIYANNLSSFKISAAVGGFRLMNGNGINYSRTLLYFNNCTNVYSPQAPDATTVLNLGAAKVVMDHGTFLSWGTTWNIGSKDDATGFSECVVYNLNGSISSNTIPAKVGGLGRLGMVFNGGTWVQTQVAPVHTISTGLYNYGWMVYSNGATYNYGSAATAQRFYQDVLRSPAGYGISGVTVSNTGAGYVGPPYVEVAGGSGTGAVVLAHIDRVLGTVTNFQVVCPGYGYLPTDTVTVSLIKGGYGSGFVPAVAGTISFATNSLRGSYLHKGTGNTTYLHESSSLFYGYFRAGNGSIWLCNTDCLHNATLDLSEVDAGTFVISNNISRVSLGGLSGSRNMAATNASGQAVTLELGNSGFTNSYSGVLSGSGGVVKVGGGVQTLAGANTYSGATLVSNGVLAIDGSLASASSVTVSGGGFLGGTGMVNGAVSVLAGGGLAPGGTNVVGMLTINDDLVCSDGLICRWKYDSGMATQDSVNVTGNLTLPAHVTIQISGQGGGLPGESVLFRYSGTCAQADFSSWTMTGGSTATSVRHDVARKVILLRRITGTVVMIR